MLEWMKVSQSSAAETHIKTEKLCFPSFFRKGHCAKKGGASNCSSIFSHTSLLLAPRWLPLVVIDKKAGPSWRYSYRRYLHRPLLSCWYSCPYLQTHLLHVFLMINVQSVPFVEMEGVPIHSWRAASTQWPHEREDVWIQAMAMEPPFSNLACAIQMITQMGGAVIIV